MISREIVRLDLVVILLIKKWLDQLYAHESLSVLLKAHLDDAFRLYRKRYYKDMKERKKNGGKQRQTSE